MLIIITVIGLDHKRGVTQLGSVSALGAESRRFESCHPEFKGRFVYFFVNWKGTLVKIK